MAKKRFYEAFVDGYKPAIVLENTSRHFEKVKNYPHFNSYENSSLCMFFQTEDQKEEYKTKIKGVKLNSYEDHLIIGHALGFPRNSINYFAKMRKIEDELGRYPKEQEDHLKVGVNWAGFEFASYLPCVLGDIGWLWGTYNHPKANGIPLYVLTKEEGYLEVPYGDFNKLKEVYDYIEDMRRLIPAVNG